MKKLLLFVGLLIGASSFGQQKHPAFMNQGNIYEVNIRQYTKEGTFKAFAKHLPRLQKMGVQTIWFYAYPAYFKFGRKGTLGSYYAVASYTDINPEFWYPCRF
jgi:alpha-amylase